MNAKMRQSLEKAFEQVSTDIVDALYFVDGNRLAGQKIHAVRDALVKIEHAVMESHKCEDCMESGLVDAPGPYDPSELRIHLEPMLPEPDMMGGPVIKNREIVKDELRSTDNKPRYYVMAKDDNPYMPFYYGTYPQCLCVIALLNIDPTLSINEMDNETGGFLSQ